MHASAKVFRPSDKVRYFLTIVIIIGLTQGLYRGVQDNYLAQVVHINEFERGIVEFFRELPGLLLVFILAVMYRFSESKVFKIGAAIMLSGSVGLLLAGTGDVIVVTFMVLFSLGEHIAMPVRSTITLHLAEEGKQGAALGVTSMILHGGKIFGFIVVSGLFILFPKLGITEHEATGFKIIFAISSLLMLAAVLIGFALKDEGKEVRRDRIYFSRKFAKYYGLETFYGARKQIFLTFAPYVLILKYGASTSMVSFLLALCAVFGMLFSPLIGRLIDKIGYKVIMIADTLILIVVCMLYGFSHRIFPMNIAFIVVSINYVLDSILTLGSLATNVYVQDIADTPEEMTSTLSTGISVNHFISIIIALLGGLIWQKVGVEALFTLAALLGIANSLFAASIKVPPKSSL
ncbi:MAG: MFS transporter [Sphaerochaetaceae bacterium]|nr:MFS transporter [Sphaerochaetaceae bacterium]